MDEELKADWNKTAKKWILACKIVILIFILCLVVLFTYDSIPLPYCVFIIGIELALSIMGIFMIIKAGSTPRRRRK